MAFMMTITKQQTHVEKIDYYKIERITKLIFLTAWELANKEERIKLK